MRHRLVLVTNAATSVAFSFHGPRRRAPAVTAVVPSCSTASFFTNVKRPFGPGNEERHGTTPSIFDLEQDVTDGTTKKEVRYEDMPSAHELEKMLPSEKQLHDELPSAMEIEKALREGHLDSYVNPPEPEGH